MSEYLDIEQKMKYHKEQILKQFIEKGIYPDNKLIADYVNRIDLNLSLFKNYNKVSGNKFNTNEYNEGIKLIYKDLSILYNILEELVINEYNDLQNFIYSYLNELMSIVNTYKSRADFENNSTTLGETLLFQNNNFLVTTNNSTTTVDLSSIEIENASILACIANVNNVDNSNIVFSFTNGDDEIRTTPYNINNTLLTMPGTKTKNVYEYTIEEDQNVNNSLVLPIDSEIDIKNKYDILGGKNMMFVNNENNSYYIQEIPNSSGSLLFTEKSYINFYVMDGKSVTFKFNKKPISTNFPIEEQTITNLDSIHHFYLECEADTYLEIELDAGNIYAIKENGIINNNKLYYTGPNVVKDFYIIETAPGEIKSYDTKLIIYNDNDNNVDIDNIVIKKIK